MLKLVRMAQPYGLWKNMSSETVLYTFWTYVTQAQIDRVIISLSVCIMFVNLNGTISDFTTHAFGREILN